MSNKTDNNTGAINNPKPVFKRNVQWPNFFLHVSFLNMFAFYLFIVSIFCNLGIAMDNTFSVLAKQVTHGNLNLPQKEMDTVAYKNNYYWPLGPFPAILLIPFTLITSIFSDLLVPHAFINIPSVIGILILCYRISRYYKFDRKDSFWIALAMVFSTVFFLSAILPWSWNICHSITFLLGLIALYYFLKDGITDRSSLIIGICHGFMLMTRFTAGLGIAFYLGSLFLSAETVRRKLKKSALLISPLLLSGFILLGYNYLRFDNALDNGYTTANNWYPHQEIFRYELNHYGLFKLENIPTNLYYYFINIPSPKLEHVDGFMRYISIYKTDKILHLVPPYIKVDPPGVSLFVVSPILLLIFRNRLRTRTSKLALLTSLLILAFLLPYYWTGWRQVGPRYVIDLLPFLFVLFLESYKITKLTFIQKTVITLSAYFNLLLFLLMVSI